MNDSWTKNTLYSYLDTSVKSKLQVVQIYFDTATYDEIERDVKVNL